MMGIKRQWNDIIVVNGRIIRYFFKEEIDADEFALLIQCHLIVKKKTMKK